MSHTPGPEQFETLRADAAFLRHYLEHYIVHVQVKDERGYVVNSFAAVQIPDWAVKQRLEDIDAAITEVSPDWFSALASAEAALAMCYEVNFYPGDGSSTQDAALRIVREAIAKAEGRTDA